MQSLKVILRQYFHDEFKKRYKRRKQDLLYPALPIEDLGVKVSMTTSNDSPQEKQTEKLMTDSTLNQLERLQSSLDQFYDNLDYAEQELLKMKYKHQYSWVKIGFELGYSERHLRRMRNDLLDRLGQKIAWYF